MASKVQKYITITLVSLLVFSVFSVVGSGVQSSEDVSKEIVLIKNDQEEKLTTFEFDILDEYGQYSLVEMNSDDIESMKENGVEMKELPSRTEISVKGHRFDISEEQPDLDPDLMIEGYSSGEKGLYLVHMLGPVNPEWRKNLEEKDIDIINYVPNYAYEVKMTPDQAEQVEDLFFVDWVGIYQPGFKLAEDIEPGLVDVKLAGKAGRETLNQIRSKAEFFSISGLKEERVSLTAEVRTEKDLTELAQMNEVYYISNAVENKLHDEVATQIIGGGAWIWDSDNDPSTPYRGDSDHGALVNQLGWTGKNETVAVADTGINPDHLDFQDRVIGGYYWESGTWEDYNGHGTHVAGSVAGNTYNGTGTTVDSFGSIEELGPYYAAQGPAYDSDLFSVKIFDSGGNWIGPSDYFDIVEVANQNSEAYIHSNSWGSTENLGEYLSSSEAYDEAVRDANRSSDENEPMVIVVAAGNEGSNQNTVGAPATAKNVIAVGSTENFMPDLGTDNPDRISSFSSRGWTDDNRIKPDVVAPGENIISTDYENNEGYIGKSGTSMATPAVSGAASVVVEWYEEQFGNKPSPGMVRALLINTAYDLDDGNGNTGPIPNKDEGWGMVNLPALMDAPCNFTLEDQNKSITTGEEKEYTINYEDPSEPLKITLTWTDKEAQAGDTWTLKNDLNLEVISPSGDKYKGNAFENGWAQPNNDTMGDFDTDDDGWDDVNNVQNVYIHPNNLETGNYTVRVIGENVPEDANNDGEANQDYALAFYNAFEVGPSIEIERPSGGEIWEYGNTEKIEWATSEDENPITSVDLEYSIDSGSSYTEIATGLGDTKSYDWDIPDVTSDEVVIRATVHDDEGYKGRDTSGLLTIKGKPPDPPENLSVQHANLKEDWHWMYNADHRVEADTAIGVDTQETWYGAIRTELPDGEMTDIAYYHGDDANSVKATIHEDSIEEPGNQIAETYTFTDFENDQWYEIPLKTRVELDSNHYWIVLEIDDPGEDFFPFGMYETAVEDGGYIKHSGTSGWETRDYTWALEVQVREADENDNLISWDASPDDPENVSHYNLYKSENEEGPWDNSTKIDDVDADGSKEYRYIDRGKGMADDTFWWYVVRAVGKNGIEEENEDTKQEPIRPLQIEIYEHDEEAVNGTEYSIRYNVTNIGESETTQTIVFTVDGEPIGNEEVKLGVGQKQQGEFNWTPEDLGFYTLKVASENHSDELTVSVLEDANFEVRIYDLDRGFIEGDKVVVSYMIENTGEVKDTQTIEFRIDGNLTNEKDVTLQGGDSERHNFTWQTGEGDTGKYEMEVASEDDRDDSRVTVLEADIFAVDIRPQTREVVEGEEIVVNYTVMNTKEEGDTQDIEFTIYYRDDVVYDDVEESVAISSREEHEGNFTWQTEEGDAGRYKVEVASEDDKDDSGFTVFKADLFVIDIDLSDRDFVDDEDIIVNYTVTNTKDKETTQDIQFIVYGDEEEIVYQDIREDVTLQSRESDEAEFVWGVEDIDTGKFEIKIASEDYNETSRITVWKANSFSVILEISDRHRDSVLREDQQISIEYSIKNTKEATDTQDIKFYVDEDLIETEEGVKLDPGERDRKQFNWTTEQPYGERTLTVESDDDSDKETIEIGEDPYFEVKINEPEDGQEFEENVEVVVNYTVTNTGDIEETQNIKFFINGEKIDERDIQLEPNESKSVELIWTAEEETGDFELRVESRDDHEIVTINVGGEAEDEEVIPGFTLEPLIIILISIVGIMIAIYVVKTLYFR